MDDELRLLHSVQASDMERLRTQALRLAREKRLLEQLVKDYRDFVQETSGAALYRVKRDQLAERTRALLEQEEK